MGDLLGSFPRKRASEDKARWKDSCWFVGPVVIPGSSHSDVGRYKWYQSLASPSTVWFEDEPCLAWRNSGMGDLPGSFPGKCVSDDKAHWKVSW